MTTNPGKSFLMERMPTIWRIDVHGNWPHTTSPSNGVQNKAVACISQFVEVPRNDEAATSILIDSVTA